MNVKNVKDIKVSVMEIAGDIFYTNRRSENCIFLKFAFFLNLHLLLLHLWVSKDSDLCCSPLQLRFYSNCGSLLSKLNKVVSDVKLT